MNPVFEKVVLVGKTVTGIKFKVIQHDFVRIVRKPNPTGVGNTVIFAINTELMQMIILPLDFGMDSRLVKAKNNLKIVK